MNKTLKIVIISLTGLLLIGGGVYAGYRYGNNKTVSSNSNTVKSDGSLSTPEPDGSKKTVVDETTNWKTYTNPTFGYSIKYPTTWTEKQGSVSETNASEDIKNTNIEFINGNNLIVRIATDYISKVGDSNLLSIASDVPAPKDKTLISGVLAYNVGSLDGYKRLVTVSNPASVGLQYITKDSKYIYYISTFNKDESSEVVNILKTFATTNVAAATVIDSASSWKTYTNSDYKFTLSFNDNWKNYQVVDMTGLGEYAIGKFRIYLPTNDNNYGYEGKKGFVDPITLNVFTYSQWNKNHAEAGYSDTYINHNSQYYFGYETWQDCPTDLCNVITGDEIKSIMQSFKFTN